MGTLSLLSPGEAVGKRNNSLSAWSCTVRLPVKAQRGAHTYWGVRNLSEYSDP